MKGDMKGYVKGRGMKGTGVYASEGETLLLIALLQKAHERPVILIPGQDQQAAAWDQLHAMIWALAKEHGLEKPRGYYGFDPNTREFIEADDGEALFLN